MKRILLSLLVYLLVPLNWNGYLRLGLALAAAFLLPKHRDEEGSISIDAFSARQKLAGRLSWQKLLFFVSCLFLSLLVKKPEIHGFIIASMLLFFLWLGLDIRSILGYMTVPLTFILLSIFSLLFVFRVGAGEKVLLDLKGVLYITESSRQNAYLVLTRALAGLSCLYGLSLSSSMGEILRVLSSFLPEKIMEILFMMYRFIFILLEFLYQMMRSSKARGGRKNFKRSLQSSGLIASSLLFRSMEQTGRSYDALLARGYQGGLPLEYGEENKNSSDPWVLGIGTLYLGILILFLLWR